MERFQMKTNNNNVEEVISSIKQSPDAQKIMQDLQIDEEELKEFYDLLLQYLRFNKNCKNCKSLTQCDHSTKGYQYIVKRDSNGFLTDGLVICPKYETYYLKRGNMVYTTYEDEIILDNNLKQFLKDNANFLGTQNLKKIVSLLKGEFVRGLYLSFTDSKLRKKMLEGLAGALLVTHKCVVAKFADLCRDLQQGSWKNKINESLFKLVCNAEIVLLDDVANESISGFSRDEVLLPLLDYRIQHDLTTIITSQFEMEKLASLYKTNYNDGLKAESVVQKMKELTI